MFLSAILLALIVGALAGGSFPRLGELKLRWSWLLAAALGLRLLVLVSEETGFADALPAGWFYVGAYLLVFVWLCGNWRVPGLQIASVGIGANMVAVLINGGQMPIWSAAFFSAGFTEADIVNDPFHFLLRTDTVAGFVAAGGLFGDVIPIPIPYIRDVVSIGDVLLALGIFWAIVYSMTRAGAPSRGARGPGPVPDPPIHGGDLPGRCRLWGRLLDSRRCRSGAAGRRVGPAGAVAVPAPGPQPQLLAAVDRPAHLDARRSDPRHRAGGAGRRPRDGARGRADLRGDRGAQRGARPAGRRARGPMGPTPHDDRLRRGASRAGAHGSVRLRDPYRPGLSGRVPHRDGDAPLPPREDGRRAGHGGRAGPGGGQLGDVGAGDGGGPDRLPGGWPDRHRPELGHRRGVRAGCRHLRRLGGAHLGDAPAAPAGAAEPRGSRCGTCGGSCARASPSCGPSPCCSRTRCSRPWPRWRSAPRSWSASSTPGTSWTVGP